MAHQQVGAAGDVRQVQLRGGGIHRLIGDNGQQLLRGGNQGTAQGGAVNLDFRIGIVLVALHQNQVHGRQPGDDLLQGQLPVRPLEQGEFFPVGNGDHVGSGGGEPIGVLAGMVHFKVVDVVLEHRQPQAPALELRDQPR